MLEREHELGMLRLEKARAAEEATKAAQLKMLMQLPGAMKQLFGSAGNVPVEEAKPDFQRMGALTTDNVTQAQVPNPNLTVDQIMQAIGKFESGGKYDALGPYTGRGDRALGKYQIMQSNLPSWSKESLGYEVSPDQFLANPELQDIIAKVKMQQYFDKYGNPADVESMWFSGRPSRNNVRRDILGTSVPQYIAGVNRYL